MEDHNINVKLLFFILSVFLLAFLSFADIQHTSLAEEIYNNYNTSFKKNLSGKLRIGFFSQYFLDASLEYHDNYVSLDPFVKSSKNKSPLIPGLSFAYGIMPSCIIELKLWGTDLLRKDTYFNASDNLEYINEAEAKILAQELSFLLYNSSSKKYNLFLGVGFFAKQIRYFINNSYLEQQNELGISYSMAWEYYLNDNFAIYTMYRYFEKPNIKYLDRTNNSNDYKLKTVFDSSLIILGLNLYF